MMISDRPSPARATEKGQRHWFLLPGGQLFQHLSDPFQFLLDGDQKLMSFSVRPFLDPFHFHLFIFQSLQSRIFFFAPAMVNPSS